ncbi:MAG TPA: serine/threonine-protein kinase [Verrucomicrobiota bacterium]|nr:serine/threonine-protein kinase [Verrucomicrobiota bacterium]
MTSLKEQEEALFDAARMLDPAAREAFLDRACAGRPEMRARLGELLSVDAGAERFFNDAASTTFFRSVANGLGADSSGAISSAVDAAVTKLLEAPGTRIGRYKLLQLIGEGGGGAVYMAEQEQPVRRRVALKIIKLGMDTKRVIARFEAERQALAMMDHPNIARVLDAGATETGRPFFVMELVRGVKITEYCDRNNLDTAQRLELFMQICHAIQHAHQKGIIHRDIKPSNILVTMHDGVPVPKVIDFGIAKATDTRLTDMTLFTAYDQLVGTPAYMSPEQAEMSGLDIDTRTDIYSLGVLLYELLTGRTPFDGKQLMQSGIEGMRRTLREREPHRPSTILTTLQNDELKATATHRHSEPPKLISLLRGDLDWIVMKALEKDRTRRYETANGLAMDIRRYLNNEAVMARPPSRAYRFQKLMRRNKAVFASGAAVALALLIGMTASTLLLFKERAAHRRALEAEREQARMRGEAELRERITQVALLVAQENYEEADELVSGIPFTEPTIEGAAVLRSLGDWHAVNGRWRAAAERFSTLLKINRLDNWDVTTLDILELGPALIEMGDVNGYDAFRRETIARFAGTTYPASDRIIKVCLLLPADETLLRELQPQADHAERSQAAENPANQDVFQAAWRSVSLALLEYRRGNFAKSADWSRRSLSYPEYNAPRSATAHVILALASWRMNDLATARSELKLARDLIETKFRGGLDRGTGIQGFWFDWVFARILLREAIQVINDP